MSRIQDLMGGSMSRHASASGLFGDPLTLYNYADVNADPTDAPDWELDDGTPIEGHIDWMTMGEVDETVGGEEVRADARVFIPADQGYDVRDGRRSGERASVIEDPDGNALRIEAARIVSGVYVCAATLRETFTNE